MILCSADFKHFTINYLVWDHICPFFQHTFLLLKLHPSGFIIRLFTKKLTRDSHAWGCSCQFGWHICLLPKIKFYSLQKHLSQNFYLDLLFFHLLLLLFHYIALKIIYKNKALVWTFTCKDPQMDIVRIHGIRIYNRPPKPTGCRLSE